LSVSEAIDQENIDNLTCEDDHMSALDCLYCGTTTALRSHRKNFAEVLRTRMTGKVPFRCVRCSRRFWLAIDPRDI
jgi:hypothetical protein